MNGEVCQTMSDAQRAALGAVPGSPCAASDKAAKLLGPDLVALARQTFPQLTLGEYVEQVWGGMEALERQFAGRKGTPDAAAAHFNSRAYRELEEKVGRDMGVPVEALRRQRIRDGLVP